MKHAGALGFKFALVAIVVFSIFTSFVSVTILNGLFISIVLVAAAYLLGDLLILRRFGNLMATISDFGLSFLVLFFYGIILGIPAGDVGNAAAFSAMFIALGEAFLHFYMVNRVFGEPEYSDEDKRPVKMGSGRLQTETSDEIFPYDAKKKGNDEEE